MSKPLAYNRRAKYDYQIMEIFEAGLELRGYEVKAIKQGKVSLKGSFVTVKDNEAWLINAHVAPYQPKNVPSDYEPERSRKLLLHKKELNSLIGKLKQKGLTLIPLKLYTKRGRIKLAFGLGKGLKKIDKREIIKKRQAERRMGMFRNR